MAHAPDDDAGVGGDRDPGVGRCDLVGAQHGHSTQTQSAHRHRRYRHSQHAGNGTVTAMPARVTVTGNACMLGTPYVRWRSVAVAGGGCGEGIGGYVWGGKTNFDHIWNKAKSDALAQGWLCTVDY